MPLLRWLHKSWNAFWVSFGIIGLTLIFIGAIGFGILQLKVTKTYIATRIEKNFSEKYEGVLTIGQLRGIVPMNFELKEVNLYPDSSSTEAVFHADSLSANLDVFALLRQEFIVTGLSVDAPTLIIDGTNKDAFLAAIKKKPEIAITDKEEAEKPFFEILAPNVIVRSGTVIIRKLFETPKSFTTSDSLSFRDINLSMFFEYKSTQRFLDINNLTMRIPEFDIPKAQVYGQIYNNNRFLEFNSFNLNTSDTYLRFSGKANDVDLFKDELIAQLKAANLDVDLDELIVAPQRVEQFLPNAPKLDKAIFATMNIDGSLDSLFVNHATLQYGNSGFKATGRLTNLLHIKNLGYNLSLRETIFDKVDAESLIKQISESQLNALTNLIITADLEGNLHKLNGIIDGVSDRGRVQLNGSIGLQEDRELDLKFKTDSLDLGGGIIGKIASSKLTSQGSLKVKDYRDFNTIEELRANFQEGQFNGILFDLLDINAPRKDGIITPIFTLITNNATLSGNGVLDLRNDVKTLKLEGSGTNVDLKNLTQLESMANAIIDVEYEVDLAGSSIDDAVGKVSVDISDAIIAKDTLSPHLIYADLSNNPNGTKLLRLTTSALDLTLEGNYYPSQLPELAKYWGTFFKKRFSDEVLFDEEKNSFVKPVIFKNHDVKLVAQVKNLDYIKTYFPDTPDFYSSARITSNISVNDSRLLFNVDVYDKLFRYEDKRADSLRAQLTGSFRYDERIRDFSGFELRTDIEHLTSDLIEAEGFELMASLNRDSITVSQSIKRIGNDVAFSMEGSAVIQDTSVTMNIHQFKLGSDFYNWTNRGTPSVTFTNKKEWIVEKFIFESEQQYLDVEGIFSDNVSDSVNYLIRGVDLGKISDIIRGKIRFSGNLNGTFTTRSLTTIPSIEGIIDLQRFAMSDNVVGDLKISSVFNHPLNRFDTSIKIKTDSTRYPEYFVRNDREGQNIEINGYVLAPKNGKFPEVDSLFNFDINLNSVDLWVIPYLAPKVFTDMAGIAEGDGKIWGNLDDYDFYLDFGIGMNDAVYMKPKFLDTYYYGQGPVRFSRHEGLVFTDIFLIDPSGGMAILDGYYNFNDFSGVHSMDINIQADEFQFLNSEFDADLPFYGKAYGSGLIRMYGSNLKPVIETTTPFVLSDFSEIGLPLLEETEFDEDSKFIRFVESFDILDNDTTTSGNNSVFNNSKEIDPSTLTFAQRFTLDLQFVANNPMTVKLVFDPVTGDVITSDGTGRLRIRLQDQDLSIFGKFDITGGTYQFVSGDIFTRKFTLESGGSIVWEGEPANARINLNAVFSARPDIQTLTSTRTERDPSNVQRVPIDLVLNIGGSLSSIQNNFYFRLPNNFESRQNSTLLSQINALNQNEEEKLLQATSFLLLEDFIPSNSSVGGASSLTDNLSSNAGAAVLNPLLSSQVISPLLSNQINSLLRSDLSTLDVDFSLNTYNQIDLGVALRLYNDKIILRRDGQITGAQSNIGDLGATYRINRTLSVSAFHRQDPTFSGNEGGQQTQQTQDINGVGIETTYGFNSWNEFFKKLAIPFRKIFGIRENKEVAAIKEEENPS